MKTWKVDDVMTEAVVSVQQTASYRSLVDLLVGRRFSAVPVVDDFHRVTGVVSEADLLRKIEYTGAEEPRLFEGRRRRDQRAKVDLLRVHLRPDDEIQQDVTDGVLATFLPEVAKGVTVAVAGGIVTLTGRVDRWTTADLAVRLTRQVAGVVDVVDLVQFDFDDRHTVGPGLIYGIA
jgi:CBS-domain-containing membrane protein